MEVATEKQLSSRPATRGDDVGRCAPLAVDS